MPTATKELRGPDLLRAVVNHIIAHPETWDQKNWHCGTKHCVGGWCQIMGGAKENPDTTKKQASDFLGLSYCDANYLFDATRTLPEIYCFAKVFIAGFDRAGFNRAGFDRDGFNREGFDREGFNREGFNRAGFDRDGFNRAGFDRDGFDRDGFNRDGFNRAGFDRDGFNRAGFDRDGKKLELVPL